MTGNELLAMALALFAETDASDETYQALAVPYINTVLAEAFNCNNRIRKWSGKEVFAIIPAISSLADTVDYEEELLRNALPYGLAAKLYFDEENDGRLSYFNQEYANRLAEADKWVVTF
jgi:hypothetical protein